MNEPSEPLGLTVHSLPTPVDAMTRQRASGRFKMLLIMAACAAPMIASYTLYYVVRPTGGATAYSDLIQPTVPMPAVPAQPLDGGAPQVLRGLAGQWLLVVVDSGACAEACEQRLFMQRQLREMNGRDRDRIDKLWLVIDDAPVKPALQQALAGHARHAHAACAPRHRGSLAEARAGPGAGRPPLRRRSAGRVDDAGPCECRPV
jgi:hypothetical protein